MLDESILHRLAYCKSLYLIASNMTRKSSDVEVAQSVVILDSSLESFFWIAIDLKKAGIAGALHDKDFSTLVSTIQEIGSIDGIAIKELHKARNNIQHNGLLLARSQAQRYFPLAEETFAKLSREVFQIEWRSISLSMLIRGKGVAELYRLSEDLSAKKEVLPAITKLIMCFETAKSKRQANQFGSGLLWDVATARFGIRDDHKSLVELSEAILGEVEVLKLGLDYKQWRDFRLIVGTLDPFQLSNGENLPDEQEVNAKINEIVKEWAYQNLEAWLDRNLPFVLNSILYWQDNEGINEMDKGPITTFFELSITTFFELP